MTDFAGTSGASAIVAGAAVLLQSWAAKHRGMLNAARLREVMSDPYINTHSSAPANDRIGVMPDLRGIIQHLRTPVRGRDDIIQAILFGAVAEDGPASYGRRAVGSDQRGHALTELRRASLQRSAIYSWASPFTNLQGWSATRLSGK